MYFRRKTSAGRAYLQIVESRRDGDQVRQQVISASGTRNACLFLNRESAASPGAPTGTVPFMSFSHLSRFMMMAVLITRQLLRIIERPPKSPIHQQGKFSQEFCLARIVAHNNTAREAKRLFPTPRGHFQIFNGSHLKYSMCR
jgi:hypothetical protein